mgnify:CR=1 FL=1
MEDIKVLLIDDHPVVRAGMEGILTAHDGYEVVGEAENGVDAVKLSEQLKPDVILMDLRMPNGDGVTAIQEITAKKNAPHILVLTTFDSDRDIVRAIEAGATGYLLKDTPRDELFRASTRLPAPGFEDCKARACARPNLPCFVRKQTPQA